MSTIENEVYTDAVSAAGMKSLAATGLLSHAELRQRLGDKYSPVFIRRMHDSARKALRDVRVLENKVLTRKSPLLPALIRRGLKRPDVSLQDFEGWFGGRFDRYANPGAVSSRFSPAAYLADLYREGKNLYPEWSPFHIDVRRPDLKDLVLSQENMDTVASALSLSNEILLKHAATRLLEDGTLLSREEVLEKLAGHVTSSHTPWHYHHARLREVRRLKDPDFVQILKAPAVTGRLGGAMLAGIYYDIPPALYDLLVEDIPEGEEEAKELFDTYFPGTGPEMVLDPVFLRNRYGLTDEEVSQIIYAVNNRGVNGFNDSHAAFVIKNGVCQKVSYTLTSGEGDFLYGHIITQDERNECFEIRFKPGHPVKSNTTLQILVDGNHRLTIHSSDYGDMMFYPGKEYRTVFRPELSDNIEQFSFTLYSYRDDGSNLKQWVADYSVRTIPGWSICLHINKLIRLYKATGLSPLILERLIYSASPQEMKITGETLAVLFRAALLMKRYGVSPEDALVMSKGLISLASHGGEASQWDRLFNTPPFGDERFWPSEKIISLTPGTKENVDIKATLKRAFQTDDEGLRDLCRIHVKGATSLTLSHEYVSGVYAFSLWSRVLNLQPGQLLTLLKRENYPEFADRPASVWGEWLNKLHSIMQWLAETGWSTGDLHLLTRDVTTIPPGTDILNAFAQLRDVVAASPDAGDVDTYITLLTPVVTGIFNLSNETAGRALLTWQDRAKTGGLDVSAFWAAVTPETDATGKPVDYDPVTDPVNGAKVVAFCYSLAQMALVCHGTGIQPDALMLFVVKPELLSPDAVIGGALDRNTAALQTLCAFSRWFSTLADTSGAGANLLTALGNEKVTTALLAQATGISQLMLDQAAEAEGGTLRDSYAWIQTLLQWVSLAEAFGVTPADIRLMLTLDYTATTRADWATWRRVADAFVAGLKSNQTARLLETVESGLSAALAGVLTSGKNRVADNREQLSQYLLADNLNGPMVKTSRIADALAALQTFIHRTLSDPESPEDLMVLVLERPFFKDWVRWNARYSTWAGGKKLVMYPENYIDPTVRHGQTWMMDDMLQLLGQAQVNQDTVGDGFMSYLSTFEDVANLETVSGYCDSLQEDIGRVYFIGRARTDSPEFWWRSVNMNGVGDKQKYPANAWTAWAKITCSLQPYGRLIRPVVHKGRLYLAWVERQEQETKRNDATGTQETTVYSWALKMARQRYNGNWDAKWSYPLTDAETTKLDTIQAEKLSMYLSAWPDQSTLIFALYERKDAIYAGTDILLSRYIRDDMTDISSSGLASNIVSMSHQFDSKERTGICAPYDHPDIRVKSFAAVNDTTPEGYSTFSASDDGTSVVELKEGISNYSLSLKMSLKAQKETFKYADLPGLAEAREKFKNYLFTAKYVFYKTSNNNMGFYFGSSSGMSIPQVLIRLNSGFLNWKASAIASITYSDGRPIENIHFATASDGSLLFCLDDINNYKDTKYKINYEQSSGFSYQIIDVMDLLSPGTIGLGDFPLQEDILAEVPRKDVYIKFYGENVPYFNTYFMTEESLHFEKGGVQTATFRADNQHFSRNWDGEDDVKHKCVFTIENTQREYELTLTTVSNPEHVVGSIITRPNGAQYFSRKEWVSEEKEATKTNIRLNTLFARELTAQASSGIDAILDYRTQFIPEPPLPEEEKADEGNSPSMDFSGANALYFWELFYYTPMMVMQRFLSEQRYTEAEEWLQYVFKPVGYPEGGQKASRYWNVRPLDEEAGWHNDPLETYDPDAVAQHEPMHYKVNAWMRLLDITVGRGDAAYRMLDQATLAEAKGLYQKALRYMGDKPWIDASDAWHNPTLGAAGAMDVEEARIEALVALAEGRSRPDDAQTGLAVAGETLFLPEANDVLLGYWDTLARRLYNLRHNLSIDGQPLNLPLFDKPGDPKALHAAAVAAAGGAGSELPAVGAIPALRFTPMLESARSMASQLIQFGGTLQQILVSQDAEALAELLATQGAEIADSSLNLQKQTLNELEAERHTLECSLDSVRLRRSHYLALYDQNMNAGETLSLKQLEEGQRAHQSAGEIRISAALLNLAPNVFGLATGGVEWGAMADALAMVATHDGDIKLASSSRLAQEESYRRRREEWDIQYKSAEKEIAVLEAQIEALNVRITSAEMQIAHMETQSAHAQAQLELFRNKLTGKAMYSWLRGRLASIYYQYYDLTAYLCLMAQKSLQYEIGDLSTSWLKTGTWNGNWAGLMAGEGLMLCLGQMEVAWMKHQKRELEVTRTVSLAKFLEDKLTDGDKSLSLRDAIAALLAGTEEGAYGEGENKVELATGNQLAVHFSLKDLGLNVDYGKERLARIRSIAVSLPALLGPYEDVRGHLSVSVGDVTLPAGCHECAISRAIQDNGMFIQDGTGDPRWGARWLPFEGVALGDNAPGMTLNFYGAKDGQKALLESLNDIILHIQFTVR